MIRFRKKLPWRYEALLAVYELSFLSFTAGAPIAVFAGPVAAYVLLLGFTAYVGIHAFLRSRCTGPAKQTRT